jgi:hypothetical protein
MASTKTVLVAIMFGVSLADLGWRVAERSEPTPPPVIELDVPEPEMPQACPPVACEVPSYDRAGYEQDLIDMDRFLREETKYVRELEAKYSPENLERMCSDLNEYGPEPDC